MQRMKTKLSAAAVSLLLAATAAGSIPFSVSAIRDPSLGMSMLAGGSQIGIKFTVTPADGCVLVVNGTDCELQNGSYILPANPAEMTEDITVSVKNGGTAVIAEKTISVSSYLQSLTSDDTYGALAQAMLNYGYSADAYFNGSADIADYGLTAAPDYSSVSIDVKPLDENDRYDLNENVSNNGLNCSYYGMNLTLLDQLQFSLFFEYHDNSGASLDEMVQLFTDTVHFGNTAAEVSANGDKYIQVKRAVAASRLKEELRFYENSGIPAYCCPAQYLRAAVDSSTTSTDLKNLCKAIYAYGEAAADMTKAETFSGRLTMYDFVTGCAGLDDYVSAKNVAVAAVTDELYDRLAGAWIEINYNGNTMQAVIADAMPYADNPSRSMGDVDIDRASFVKFIGSEGGDLPITWKIIENPYADTENMSLKLKSGSSRWWMQLQFQNSRYPIAEVSVSGDKFGKQYNENNLFYGFYGLYEIRSGIVVGDDGSGNGNGDYSLKLTDIYGNTVTGSYHVDWGDQPFSEDTVIPLDIQFPS